MASRKEIAARLNSVPLFSRCTASDLRIVARHTERMSVEEGRLLCRQGDQGDALFVILDGTAVVERNGREVARLGAGDYFGELSLLDPGPRAASVTVTSDADLAVLGVRMFRVLLRDVPTISAKLLADMAARLRDAGDPDAR